MLMSCQGVCCLCSSLPFLRRISHRFPRLPRLGTRYQWLGILRQWSRSDACHLPRAALEAHHQLQSNQPRNGPCISWSCRVHHEPWCGMYSDRSTRVCLDLCACKYPLAGAHCFWSSFWLWKYAVFYLQLELLYVPRPQLVRHWRFSSWLTWE